MTKALGCGISRYCKHKLYTQSHTHINIYLRMIRQEYTHSDISETFTGLKRLVTGFDVVAVCVMSHSV